MEHLPKAIGARGPLPQMPCLCAPPYYDGGDFETYPYRRGFELVADGVWAKYVLNKDRSPLTPEALGELAQAWLFFGLLIEVLKVSGVTIDPEDFIQRESQGAYITTMMLPEYLEQWEKRESERPKKDRKRNYRRQQDIMMVAINFQWQQITGQWWPEGMTWRLGSPKPTESYKTKLPLPLTVSITVLGETLDRASRRAYGIDHNSPYTGWLNPSLIEELEAGGWCASEISLVLQGLNDTAGFFASRLDRQRTRADHSSCSANKCVAFNIAAEEYETKHAIGCRGCGNVHICRHELSSVLRRNQTPRARIWLKGLEDTCQADITMEDSGPYIAVSHVWSDGLGNATANSLPTCQLSRLRNWALKLNVDFADGDPRIWIDSLLLPVEKGHEKRLALNQLSRYYQAATKVLVLDSDLIQASSFCSTEEQLTRVFFSTWMRRLWTLEEGVLSREKLEFQFRDGTVSMNRLIDPRIISASHAPAGYILNARFLNLLPNFSNHYGQSDMDTQPRQYIIADLLPALQYRSTTKVIDEPICIAHILGLDASRLVAIDDAQLRMRELFKLFTEHQIPLPMDFLFTSEPKLPLDGFRWAPTSFMTFGSEDIAYLSSNDQRRWTICTGEGLLVTDLESFSFNLRDEVFKKITFVELDRVSFALVPTPIGESCRDKERFWTRELSGKALNIDPNLHWAMEWQELLGKSSKAVMAVLHVKSKEYGLLVSIYKYEAQSDSSGFAIIHCRPIGQMRMYELGTEAESYLVAGADSTVIRMTNPNWDFQDMERRMRSELANYHDPEVSTFLKCVQLDESIHWIVG